MASMSRELCAKLKQLNLCFVTNKVELVIEPTLELEIRKGQLQDKRLKEITENILIGKAPGFRMDDNGTLWFGKRLCVPENKAIRDAILREAHESAYSIHPRSTKMYLDLKEKYGGMDLRGMWLNMLLYVLHVRELKQNIKDL